MHITSEMLKAARALLRWRQEELAQAAGISVETVRRLENAPGPIRSNSRTADAIESALAKQGIEFTTDRGEGVLRLHEPKRQTE